jgi:hypothetical protein
MKNKYIRRAHVSELKFREILRLLCADVPAITVSKLAGMSAQCTQRLYDRLRLRILDLTVEEATSFAGEAEVDEP